MCEKYLLTRYGDIITSILEDLDENKHFSVNVEFVELVGTDTALGTFFLEEPEKALEEWNSALKKVQQDLIRNSGSNKYKFKVNIHCRMYKFPLFPDFHKNKFPQNEDIGKFLEVSGTVVRVTAVKMFEHQRQYICAKCKYLMTVAAQYELKNIIIPPKKCTNPEFCKSANVISSQDLNMNNCKDYQEIRIQEAVSKLDVGSIPNSMWITLEDDLVDSCKPGDNITVCGFVKKRQNQFCVGKKMEIELVIKANHIHVDNAESSSISGDPQLKEMFQAFWKTYANKPLVARDMILKSICPQIYGLYTVKLAMAVVLAGGSNTLSQCNTGVRVRAEPHLLLVGDPGTGKSQLLRFASKVIARSVLTTGVGSTAAGLTVAAVMENGDWQLEGGALVMSDGGICCIDEFNTMKAHDRTSIHEAMEQQTISVAKASIVCKLSTRCSILAATNPKSNLDPSHPLNMNVALPSPLLSRFDLILLIRDCIDEEWDSKLTDYMFSSEEDSDVNWTVESLQAYYVIIKNIHPTLTEDSNKVLSNYYQAQRRSENRNKSRTTVRLLDSLVRLSQGHARLMSHDKVEIMDALTAIMLVEMGTENDSSLFNLSHEMRSDFPSDPMDNYKELGKVILQKLHLDDLLEKELARMKSLEINQSNMRTESCTSSQVKKLRFSNLQNKFTQEKIVTNEVKRDKIKENHVKVDSSNTIISSEGSSDLENIKKMATNIVTNVNKPELLKHCEVQNDLAALGCMRSINSNMFFENDCIDDRKDLQWESFETEKCESNDTMLQLKNCKNEYSNEGGIKSEDNTETIKLVNENHECNKIQHAQLSKPTPTRNIFNRFRFIAKDRTNMNNERKTTAENTSENFGKIIKDGKTDVLAQERSSNVNITVSTVKERSNKPKLHKAAIEPGETIMQTFTDISFTPLEASTQREILRSGPKNSLSLFDNQENNEELDFDI